jgi:hypothetical protein
MYVRTLRQRALTFITVSPTHAVSSTSSSLLAPRPLLLLLLLLQWGGKNIGAGSNIVFSNGLTSCWHGHVHCCCCCCCCCAGKATTALMVAEQLGLTYQRR